MQPLEILRFVLIPLLLPPVHGAPPDPERLRAELRRHPAHQQATWAGWLAKPLDQRIQTAPASVLDFLGKDNQMNGYDAQPVAAMPAAEFLRDLKQAIAELPIPVRKQATQQVAAIFLVKNLGTTAYVNWLAPAATNQPGFMVLDVAALHRSANQWATWKEGSPFRQATAGDLQLTIELDGADTRKNAIQYIFLHELGHLVGLASQACPYWGGPEPAERFGFSKLSWRGPDGRYVAVSDPVFALRPTVKYYEFERAPLSRRDLAAVYRQWEQTEFVSLYAATNPADDFAETYAMYVHVVLQRKPWRLRLTTGPGQIREFEAPINQPRCAAKKAWLNQLLRGP